ncbi:MAG: hypothetical protein ACYC40_01585 [Patescibacteria group bacterium]
MKKLLIICLTLLVPLPLLAQATIDPNFNPEKIISDSDMLNYDSMDLTDIQNFLISKNSFLANYNTVNAHGTPKSAAEIIYDASHNNFDCDGVTLSDTPTEAEKQLKCKKITTVSPKLLFVTLQKEASLIEDQNPSQSHLDWAMGYGCPDGWVCNPYYKGFGKQVNSTALQFLAYMNESQRYNYKAGQTYTISNTLDPYCTIANQTMTITPQNQATASLYNYTPHVFNGNYNVYKLWNRYFPTSFKLYPDGSVLQAKNDTGLWLIENGKKRPFLNYSAFLSRYKPAQILSVKPEDLDNYQQGDPIKFSNYSLVQTPDKTIYLLVDKEKRPFASLAAFKGIGFSITEIENATTDDLANYQIGKAITATSTYVTGALLQDIKSGGVFYVENGVKAPLTDKALLTTKFLGKKIVRVSPIILAAYPKTDPVLFGDGTLLKTENFPRVYLISNGQKRPFTTESGFSSLGYNFQNVITVSSQFLSLYSIGEEIK